MEKLVSIMVLTYNHQEYIRDCLESIYDQTYKNIELIITDNASTDDTVTIIEDMLPKLELRFTHVEFEVNKSNVGIVAGINQAAKKLNGEYIKDFSGDDILMNDAIEKLVTFMEYNPEIDMVVGNGYRVDSGYKYQQSIDKYKGEAIYSTPLSIDSQFLRGLLERDNISAPAVLLRGNVFQKYGFFNEEFPFEDWEFWLRIVSQGGKIGVLDYPIVLYRRSPQSVTYMEKGKEKSERKLWMYYINNMMILDEYGQYISKKELDRLFSKIFTKYFVMGMELRLKNIVNMIWKDGKKRDINISVKDYLRYGMYILGIYEKQKQIRKK